MSVRIVRSWSFPIAYVASLLPSDVSVCAWIDRGSVLSYCILNKGSVPFFSDAHSSLLVFTSLHSELSSATFSLNHYSSDFKPLKIDSGHVGFCEPDAETLPRNAKFQGC
jgi:hypothetical protein